MSQVEPEDTEDAEVAQVEPPDDKPVEPLTTDAFAAAILAKSGTAANQIMGEDTEGGQEEAEEAETPDDDTDPETQEEDTDGDTETLEEAQQRAEDELPTDATQEEIDQARQDAADEFYVGRYKTREAAEAAYAEKDATILRLHQERDQLRREAEERAKAAAETEPEEIDQAAWRTWAEEQVEALEDPRQAEALAVKALEVGGYDGYQVFLAAWLESEDPAVRSRATPFNNSVMLEMSRVRAEAAAAPRHQEDDRQQTREQALDAREKIAARYADFAEMEKRFPKVSEELDDETRDYLTQQAAEGVDGKARVMDYLYLRARATATDSKQRAKTEEKRQRVASADRDKLAATVQTGEAKPTRTTLSETESKALAVRNARRREWGLEELEE